MQLTYKVPIQIPNDRTNDLKRLFEIVKYVYDYHVDWAYESKTYRKDRAHKELYKFFRTGFPELPCQYIQTTRDQALETVKRQKFRGKKPRKKLWSSVRLTKGCTISFWENTGRVTFSCIGKRVTVFVPLDNSYFKERFKDSQFYSATLRYSPKKKKFWLNLSFQVQVPEVKSNVTPKVVGVDLGIHNIMTLSDGTIINSKTLKRVKRKYSYLRKKLQAKGTRSAKRLLKKISGKEMRFSRNFNHILSKQLVNLDYDVIVFEKLTNIRKQAKTCCKTANRMLANWSFGQLQNFTTYKVELAGKEVYFVDARYTSQKCSVCGHIEKSNRYKSKFKCLRCGFTCHADINAAINIRNNFLSSHYETDRQAAINQPYVSALKVQVQT